LASFDISYHLEDRNVFFIILLQNNGIQITGNSLKYHWF